MEMMNVRRSGSDGSLAVQKLDDKNRHSSTAALDEAALTMQFLNRGVGLPRTRPVSSVTGINGQEFILRGDYLSGRLYVVAASHEQQILLRDGIVTDRKMVPPASQRALSTKSKTHGRVPIYSR